MKLAIKTCTLDMPYEQMLDFCVGQKVAALEIGTGNWSGAPHCDLDRLVSDKTAREAWYDAMRARGLELCALNCSGNPLAYEREMNVFLVTSISLSTARATRWPMRGRWTSPKRRSSWRACWASKRS